MQKNLQWPLQGYSPLTFYVHSITGDNGTEFADHQNISKLLKTQFFFTHPFSSWEKGLIENTNKLIRQYIPEKQTLIRLINNKLQKYNIKSTIDPEKI